jgi:alpha-tubulin suppressor-like RCC1 family protein
MPTPSEIQTSIDSLTTSCDSVCFPLLAAQTSAAGVGISFVVNTVADLPDLATKCIGFGQTVFVKSICVPVISTCTSWVGLDGRVLRRDWPLRQMWTWGRNICGPLGDNTVTNRSSPVREITSSVTWCQTSAGSAFTSAIKTDSTLWTWGYNVQGQLGDNTVTSRSSPVREITSSTTWCQTSAGNSHNSALKTDGTLWTWGYNGCGRLGDNTVTSRSSPVREITSSTTWCQTSSGSFHTSALKTDGTLWSWGNNYCGMLGDTTVTNRSSPVREITSSTTWRQTSAGKGITISAVKTDGTLWSWGCNRCGQLGDNTVTNRSSPVREISSSTTWCQTSASAWTSAIKTDGTLWSWGFNQCGQLGINNTGLLSSPGREITNSTTWCQTSAGSNHNTAIKTDGTLWTWGFNDCGVLGDNTVTNRSSPVREISSSTAWCQTSAGSMTAAILQCYN